MSNTQVVRKIIEKLAREVQDWNVKSSNMHSSDADWYIGFGADVNTANENEYDPKTGKLIKNDEIGDDVTYLNHWDADNTGYLEGEDVKRDNGVGLARIVMQQVTPIKS
jgi:hypothetical protein